MTPEDRSCFNCGLVRPHPRRRRYLRVFSNLAGLTLGAGGVVAGVLMGRLGYTTAAGFMALQFLLWLTQLRRSPREAHSATRALGLGALAALVLPRLWAPAITGIMTGISGFLAGRALPRRLRGYRQDCLITQEQHIKTQRRNTDQRASEANQLLSSRVDEEARQALLKARDAIEAQRTRLDAALWRIQLARWQNKLAPLSTGLTTLNRLEPLRERVRDVEAHISRGEEMVRQWELRAAAQTDTGAETIRNGHSSVELARQLRMQLVRHQAVLLAQDTEPVEEAYSIEEILPLDLRTRIDEINTQVRTHDFYLRLQDLKGESERLDSEMKGIAEADRLLRKAGGEEENRRRDDENRQRE